MALKEVFAAFGIEIDSKKLDEADKKIDSFIGKLEGVGKALVTGVAAVGFASFVKSLADTGDALNDASNRLGIGTDALQELSFAADQSGARIENLTTGLLLLNDKVGDALINKTGESAKAFEKYGISLRNASGEVKTADELFSDYADRIGEAKTDQEKLTIAVDAFGKQGRTLLPLLKEGSSGINAMRKRAQELGEGFSKDAVKAGDDFNDSLTGMSRVIQTLRGRLAVILLPLLRRLVEVATSAAAGFASFLKNSAALEATISVLSAALATKLIPQIWNLVKAFAPLALPLAVFIGLVLVVDELITLFRGGKTVIGEFLDALYGKGTAANFPWDVRHILDGIVDGFRNAYDAARVFFKAIGGESLSVKDIAAINRVGQAGNVFGAPGLAVDVPNTEKAATQARIRAEAAKSGQTVRFPGDPGFGVRATATAPVAGAGTAVDARTNVTVQLSGTATEKDALLIKQVLSDMLDPRAQDIKAALVPAVPR